MGPFSGPLNGPLSSFSRLEMSRFDASNSLQAVMILRTVSSMDESVPKLPRYVFRRANGSYRYKRNVPKALVQYFGKRTLYRQLGTTYSAAMKEFPYVHARIESLFALEHKKTDQERALGVIRGNLGDVVANHVLAGTVDEYSQESYALNELAESLDGTLPHRVLEQIYQGELKEDPITLNRVLDDYLHYKAVDGEDNHDTKLRVERIRKEMTQLYGRTKMNEVPFQEVTRQDANALRDLLLTKMAPNSVQRTIGVLKAAINHTIIEQGLNPKNVFASLLIRGAGASRTDRLPITDDQLTALLKHAGSSQTATTFLITLADTGARLGEVCGLEAKDVDLENRILHIRPNSYRGLKTKSSNRRIPLSPRATKLLKGACSGLEDNAPVFTKYARPRGSDAASAMLMKWLRGVIADPKVTVHSLRHRLKDKLRNTGCPEALSNEILGHSQGTTASNYGSGYAIEVMRAAMARAWETDGGPAV